MCVWVVQCLLQASMHASKGLFRAKLSQCGLRSCGLIYHDVATGHALQQHSRSRQPGLPFLAPVCCVSGENPCQLMPWATAEFSAEALLQSAGKGKPLPAVVEAVANGSTLRVSLLPELTPVTVLVVGTQVSAYRSTFCPAHAVRSDSHCAPALQTRLPQLAGRLLSFLCALHLASVCLAGMSTTLCCLAVIGTQACTRLSHPCQAEAVTGLHMVHRHPPWRRAPRQALPTAAAPSTRLPTAAERQQMVGYSL